MDRIGAAVWATGRAGQEGPSQDGPWEDFDPTWAPDGKRILFVRAKGVTTATGPGLEARTVAAVPSDGAGSVVVEHTETAAAQVMTRRILRCALYLSRSSFYRCPSSPERRS